MIRKFVASKKTILLSFSHGGKKNYYSSVIGPKFPLSDCEKTRFNWRPWSERLASGSKNDGNNSHENNSENSLEDEFSELGPSVITSSHKLDFRPLMENQQNEKYIYFPLSLDLFIYFLLILLFFLSFSLINWTKDSTERAQRFALEDSTNDKKAPDFFKIRIRNPGTNISEVAIHNMCSSHGPVLNLVRTKDGTIDVLFNVKNKSEAQVIANKLNKSTVDGARISAELLASETYGKWNYGSFIDSRFDELFGSFRKELELQRIYLDDLEHLRCSVLHLKAHPIENSENYSKSE